ncbi:MFS transporter [Lachnoclostridium sp. Marseille-P6806]|uniref:MFS transporter n=1 Tax=Lachnoclostridium sp. Marseille-P6806 TaxID=2364793 RepID=UPI001F5E8FBB|nr:MFS transporter [Lachnoclostridium sp. Marseille-P6806]
MDRAAEKRGKVRDPESRIGFGKLMIWQSRMISTTILVLLYGFLMIYCTDTLKVNPALVSVLLMASKVVDGITDAVAGFLVDKTKTRWGKARPYEVFIVGFWLCTWLLFSTPVGWSQTVKAVWIFAMYCLANAVCYTFLNANGTPYMVRAFKDKQIVKLTSYGSVVTMLVAVVFNVAFPMIMARVATSAAGWSALVAMFAVPFAAIGLLRMLFVPEKYDVDAKAGQTEQLKLRDIVTCVKTNRYILILALMNLVFNFVCNMGVNVYYYTYIVKNVDLMGVASLATVVVIPLAFLFPRLIAKFSTIRLMTAGFLISALGYLLNFFAGSHIVLLLIAAVLTGAGTVPASMLIALVIIECADFNEWQGNHRMEGTMSSITGLASKVGAAAGTGILGILLAISGFTGDAATTPESSVIMIRMLFSLVPMILYILTALTLRQYKLGGQIEEIRADNQKRRDAIAAQNGTDTAEER